MSENKHNRVMMDGNTATATIAYTVSEVCAIYPITPSSPMGELADEMSAAGVKNLWGTVPIVVELQSEAGAAAAIHGAATAGALTTTFTASQGLLLMIPTMYKLAGELTPTVFHVSARSLACQALSIFGDHSDVMAVRQTGFALIASNSVQETADLALIAHASSLRSRIPFLHFFDGFRTSHEIQQIEAISRETIRAMIDDELVHQHRQRALTPDRPSIRGTSQNPDVYFQGRETVNKFYLATPAIVQQYMDRLAKLTGRVYHIFDYIGAPDAKYVIVIMGSGAETVHETVEYLNLKGEKVGVVKVRLYRPFDVDFFIKTLPHTVERIAVLDRTKEPGAVGEPLYEDVRSAINEAIERGIWKGKVPLIIGGRYGLGSKEFTPSMVKAIFDNLSLESPKNHFTVGITDDVTHTSLDFDPEWHLEYKDRFECVFYGLGSDGTVSANKNSIKIIGSETDYYAQGYFVYDSKKAGTVTVSHLRFGSSIIRSPYLCTNPDFVACHQFSFLEKYDMLSNIKHGGTFLLNSPYPADEVWEHIPDEVAQQIIDKKINFYVIDAAHLAKKVGLGNRINTIMQTCFFAISKILPKDEVVKLLKKEIQKTYGRKGEDIIQKNYQAVDSAIDELHKVDIPQKPAGKVKMQKLIPDDAPQFVKEVTQILLMQKGDLLPVSKIPADGTWPTGTTKFEKRNIAIEIPEWNPTLCIQCTMCSLVCPHAAIRPKVYSESYLKNAPDGFKYTDAKGKEFEGMKFTIQVAPEDCTGCGLCINVCPGRERDPNTKQFTGKKALTMVEQIPVREREKGNFNFFLSLPDPDVSKLNKSTIKGSQLCQPLFEFSGACAGCGETPYVKLLTQLFGDRLIIANATGCSSIYGGNLPTTPYCKRADDLGPAWSNSLFEDAAEFGYGMRLAVDKLAEKAREILKDLKGICNNINQILPDILINDILNSDQSTQAAIEEQRKRIKNLKEILKKCSCPTCKELYEIADWLVKKSVWSIGGDGWAYDIGYGGLDHVMASGRNIKALVLDTEVYSNTGGQASKATPIGAVAKFASKGKPVAKKNLALMLCTYGNIYVATVSLGANPAQAVKAFVEADEYNGPACIIAYCHCIAHGLEDMSKGLEAQKAAVNSGHFILFRFNPELLKQGKNPFILDSKEITLSYREHAMQENRFQILMRSNKEEAEKLLKKGENIAKLQMELMRNLANASISQKE